MSSVNVGHKGELNCSLFREAEENNYITEDHHIRMSLAIF